MLWLLPESQTIACSVLGTSGGGVNIPVPSTSLLPMYLAVASCWWGIKLCLTLGLARRLASGISGHAPPVLLLFVRRRSVSGGHWSRMDERQVEPAWVPLNGALISQTPASAAGQMRDKCSLSSATHCEVICYTSYFGNS